MNTATATTTATVDAALAAKRSLAAVKANETRKRLAEERAKLEVIKNGTDEEPVADDGAVIEINLAHGVNVPEKSHYLPGLRRYVVLEAGRREARLFDYAGLGTYRLDRVTFDKYAKAVRANRRKIAGIIRANVKTAKALGLSAGGAAVKEALAVLKPAASGPAPLIGGDENAEDAS